MALIFQVTHTVTFGTQAGEDYQWELDLLRSYDDSEAVPAWTTDTTVQVTAQNSPIKVEWMSDSDVYKPIMASKAEIGLHKIAGDLLPRFTSAGQFEYQARLRYRRNGESTLNDYWCGFIQSSDGSEDISDVSPSMNFTAIDNLGGMEDGTVKISSASITHVNVFDQLLESLRQTGLDLPVLVDSGIQNASGDALIDVTAHPYSLFKSDEDNVNYRKKLTNKEMIGGLLSAFNCKVFQSYGKWFIVNASTHGGVGTNETATFAKYIITNQEYVSDGTEDVDLIYHVGGSTPDLVVANSDLQLNTNRPFGSVECKPKNVKEKNYMTNGLLQSGTDGFLTEATAFEPILDRISMPQDRHPSTRYAVQTSQSRFRLDTIGTVWFKTEPIHIDVNAPITVGFDYLLAAQSNSQTVSIHYVAVMTTANAVSVTGNYTNDLANGYFDTAIQGNFTYNFDNDKWDAGTHLLSDYKTHASKRPHQGRAQTSEYGVWNTESAELNLCEYYDRGTNENIVLDGTIQLYVFLPQAARPGRARWEGSNNTRCTTWVTNVKIKNKYSSDFTKPTFERVQADYTKTETYSPMWGDSIPSAAYNRLDQEGFWRDSETVAESTTLERIVTQQKLNDNRDEFRFYEGTMINISSDPIAPHHKLKMDWNNYIEAETLIFKGGTFRAKEGTFDISHYAPNQSTDIAPGDGVFNDDGEASPGFYEQDINLVSDKFTGRSEMVTYSLALVPQGLDDLGNLFTVEPLTIEDLSSGVLHVTGTPGAVTTHAVKITVAENYEASASNMNYFDGTNQGTGEWQLLEDGEDTAEALSNITFRDLGRELEIVFDLTLPSRSEFEQLRIMGEVDPFVGSNRDFDLTFALEGTITNAVINNTTRSLRGIPGTTASVNVIVTPATGKELDAANYSATTATGVTINSVEQMGTSVYIEVEVEFQEDDAAETITISGSSATDIPAGTDLSTVTLTVAETITNVSISRTSLVLTGIVGTTAIYDITAHAADGFLLNAGNFSTAESAAWLSAGNAVGGGETVLIPLEITFPQADASATATVSGSAQAVGGETISIAVGFTNNVAGSSLIDSSETFVLNHGQRISYTNTLTPNKGTFMDAVDLTITETVDTNNVVAFVANDAGGGSINISTSIVAPSSGSSVSADIELSGTTSSEPYLATINLTETLPLGRITQNTLSQRFGASDSNVVFSGLTVVPTSEDTGYASGTTLVVTGGTAGNYTYTDGNISFDLTVPLPVFNSALPIGNTAIDVELSSTAQPAGQSTFVSVNATGLRNCTVTLQGSEDLNQSIPFSASNTTITVVATKLSAATFDTSGMNQPVFGSTSGVSTGTNTGSQSSTSFTFTTTLPPQTTTGNLTVTLSGGADLDVDAVSVNGISIVIGQAPSTPAINTLYFS